MKTIMLSNNNLIFETNVKVTITRFDLVAVACLAITKGKELKRRNKLLDMTLSAMANVGTAGIVKINKQHYNNLSVANQVVDRLFPELSKTGKSVYLLKGSNN